MLEENNIENEITYYVFIKEHRWYFAPQYVVTGATTVQWIFPVPEPDAVGTIDKQNNCITLIKFDEYGKAPECISVIQNSDEDRYELFYYRFSSNFANDMIVYSQLEDVMAVNMKTREKSHIDYRLSEYDSILGICFLDPQKKRFIVAKSVLIGKNKWGDFLHIVKLEDQKLVETGWKMYIGETDYISSDIPLYKSWYVHDRKLFVYDKKWHKIICTDGKISVKHQFSEVFNAKAKGINIIKDFALHPKQPFGIMIEEDTLKIQSLVLLRWDITSNRKQKLGKQIVSYNQELQSLADIFGFKRMMFAYQSFSPNGDWYVVGCVELQKSLCPHFIAIPVTPIDKTHPYFLDIDNLVILGQVAGLTTIAWTSDPTSYVVSNGELLHKWDLDELPNARIFEMPVDDERERKMPILRKVVRFLGRGK